MPMPDARLLARQSRAGAVQGSSRRSNVALSLRREVPCRFHVQQRMQSRVCQSVVRGCGPAKAALGCTRLVSAEQRSPLAPPRGALQFANSAINADHHVPMRGAGAAGQPKPRWAVQGYSRRSNVALSLRREVPCSLRIQQSKQTTHVPMRGVGAAGQTKLRWAVQGSSRRSETATSRFAMGASYSFDVVAGL